MSATVSEPTEVTSEWLLYIHERTQPCKIYSFTHRSDCMCCDGSAYRQIISLNPSGPVNILQHRFLLFEQKPALQQLRTTIVSRQFLSTVVGGREGTVLRCPSGSRMPDYTQPSIRE